MTAPELPNLTPDTPSPTFKRLPLLSLNTVHHT